MSNKWYDIPEYEGMYQINKNGEVKSIRRKIKTSKGHYQTCGGNILAPYYGSIELCKDHKRYRYKVCELVAQAFMPNYVSGMPIYHINGTSDKLSNLSLTVPKNDNNGEWKDIPGYEGYYQASIYGKIRSVNRMVEFRISGRVQQVYRKSKILAENITQDNYVQVILSVNGVAKTLSVHRLVAQTFLPNPENKPQVNHIDGNTQNNNVNNLEWATRSENMTHAKDTGLWNPKKCGEISRKLTGIKVRSITDNIIFDSLKSAGKYYGMDAESVKESAIVHRPRKGIQFEFVD